MRILVTGGAGFIGSHFIKFWLKKYSKDKIINLDKLTYASNLDSLESLKNNDNYQFVKGDIGDSVIVDQLVSQVDWIVHFAAESHVDRSLINPTVFIKTNVLGTYVLLDSAVKHKIKKFHHVSTDEVFGELPLNSSEKFNEETAYDPRSPYSASKAASDHFVRSFYHSFDLPVTITNCSNNYGTFQHPEKFIPRMITNLIDGKKIPIYGDGKYVRDWLFVEDHCRAIELVMKKGKPGDTFCIGGMTKDVSNLELARAIIKIMGKTEDSLEYVVDRAGHDRRYAVSWDKASRELGWKPMGRLEQWLKVTVDWYIDNESWWRGLKNEAEEFYQQLSKKRKK